MFHVKVYFHFIMQKEKKKEKKMEGMGWVLILKITIDFEIRSLEGLVNNFVESS